MDGWMGVRHSSIPPFRLFRVLCGCPQGLVVARARVLSACAVRRGTKRGPCRAPANSIPSSHSINSVASTSTPPAARSSVRPELSEALVLADDSPWAAIEAG